MDSKQLVKTAQDVLKLNDLGGWTRPTAKLYPHQWLWDSCFIAIGLRHIDLPRAQEEIRMLLRGQWKNGMIPYIIFGKSPDYHAGPTLWRSHLSPNCPPGIKTSGGTQPPMIAEAVVRLGEQMSPKERKAWYREMYPAIARFHEWFYRDRDPKRTGLITLVHSWESGLDNNPPWMELLHLHALSRRLWLLDKSQSLTRFMERFRKDTSVVPANERMSTLELLAFYDIVREMRRLKYDDKQMLQKQKLLVVDLVVNSILVRATQHLGDIAKEIGEELPPLTAKAYKRGVSVLDELWDPETKQYYNKDYRTGKLVKMQNISTFLPLYAGKLPHDRVQSLLKLLHDPMKFGADHTVPTTPLDSPYFKPHCYWQGPVWVNVNWLIMQGLRANGQAAEADKLRTGTLDLISKGGMHEYFSPLDGRPAGAPNFSWTAALTLQMLHEMGRLPVDSKRT
jgi:hypothetical protein